MKRLLATVALIASLPLSAIAADRPIRECFQPERVRSFEVVAPDRVILDLGRQEWEVTTRGECRDLDNAEAVSFSERPNSWGNGAWSTDPDVRFVPRTYPPSRVCERDMIWLVPIDYGRHSYTESCRIDTVRRLR